MKGFKEHQQNLQEARSRGEAMEDVIVSAVNGKPQGDEKYNIDAEAGVKVAEFLKKNNIKGKGDVLGADTINVSPEWSRFWDGKVPASTKTPKTDFTIGKAKISLKSGSAAQLMSGGKNESVATFYAALEKTGDNIEKNIADKVRSMFETLAPSSVAKSNLRQVIKDESDEVVNKANKAHKQLMGELEGIFAKNEKFRDAFAYEAMSGEVKFGNNNGTCTHFLVTDFDGSNSKLHSVTDSAYVSKIAKQMKVSVRFKTTSVKKKIDGKQTKTGEYRYWSAVGLILDKMNEEVNDMLETDYLTEGSIRDFFSKVWKKFKAFFAKAIEYIKKGVKNALDFLEVKPEIRMNNKVKF